MKLKIFATAILVFTLPLACIGWSNEQKEVFDSYNSILQIGKNENWSDLYFSVSEESQMHLNNLAEIYTQAGVPLNNSGQEFLASLISDTNILSFSETVISIEFRNETAYLTAGTGTQMQTYQFIKEERSWKLNLTPILTEFINETMSGVPNVQPNEITPTVITVGNGDCEFLITNKLLNLSIWNVYCSSSDSDSWGEDWLNSSILGTDATLVLKINAGVYDVKIIDADEYTYTLWEIDVNNEGVVWQVTEADKDDFTN